MSTPRIKFSALPYSHCFTDIDKSDSILEIGNSEYFEDVFNDSKDDNPKLLTVICELIPHIDFKNVSMNMKYRNEIDSNKYEIVSFNLYNNSTINMNGIVSSIDVIAKTVLSSQRAINIKNHRLYTKNFIVQTIPKELKTIEEITCSGIDTKTHVYPFAGCLRSYMEMKDIQPYLFYIGHEYNQSPYINLVSATDFFKSQDILVSENIAIKSLSTLEDDITDGKIELKLKNSNAKYISISSSKNTLTNTYVSIIFEKHPLYFSGEI